MIVYDNIDVRTDISNLYTAYYNRVRKYLSINDCKFTFQRAKIFSLLPLYFDKYMDGYADKSTDSFGLLHHPHSYKIYYHKGISNLDLERVSFLAQFGMIEDQEQLSSEPSDIFLITKLILDTLTEEQKVFMSLTNGNLNRFIASANDLELLLEFYEDLRK